MAAPLYFRQYHIKRWDYLTPEEQAECLAAVDREIKQADQQRIPHHGDRPIGVAALPNGGFTFMWGVRPIDQA